MQSAAPAVLEVSNLACRRGGRLVFADFSFRLAPGEALVVRGVNGSGKSSLLRLLAGLLTPETGSIRFAGAEIAADLPRWHRRIAWLGHRDGLKPAETPAEFMRFSARVRDLKSDDPATALDMFGMTAEAHTALYRLSAGQKRRVALATVFAAEATLWLLDEPTTALDSKASTQFQVGLARHVDAGGMAVITAHDALPRTPCMSELILGGER